MNYCPNCGIRLIQGSHPSYPHPSPYDPARSPYDITPWPYITWVVSQSSQGGLQDPTSVYSHLRQYANPPESPQEDFGKDR